MEHVYGYCPKCGLPGIARERRMNGNDTCTQGHVYPSSEAIQKGDPLKTQVTIDDLKKLERHLNAIEVANFDGTASMAQMVVAQHEALIRILDYLVQCANKERMTQALQSAAKPVSDTCEQIIGEIEKIKQAMPPPMLVSNAREGMIKALEWARDMSCDGCYTIYDVAITRLENGGEL